MSKDDHDNVALHEVTERAREWWKKVFLTIGENVEPPYRSAYLSCRGFDAGWEAYEKVMWKEFAQIRAEQKRISEWLNRVRNVGQP